jgi:hypothetical protein
VRLAGALGAAALLIVAGWLVLRHRERSEFDRTLVSVESALAHGLPEVWSPELGAAMGQLIAAARRHLEDEQRG